MIKFSDFFNYDPDTGLLTWKVARNNRVKPGDRAGSVQINHKGEPWERQYLHVRLDHRYYLVHRIAVQIMTGRTLLREVQVDHRDGNGLNNRWKNLRWGTPSQNMGNRDRNRSRVLYVARFLDRPIKYSKSLDEVVAAYNDAARKYFGEFARPSVIQGGQRESKYRSEGSP